MFSLNPPNTNTGHSWSTVRQETKDWFTAYPISRVSQGNPYLLISIQSYFHYAIPASLCKITASFYFSLTYIVVSVTLYKSPLFSMHPKPAETWSISAVAHKINNGGYKDSQF